jgi:hypothetical protein
MHRSTLTAGLLLLGFVGNCRAEPEVINNFEMRTEGKNCIVTYKGTQELHQIAGPFLLFVESGTGLAKHTLWATWKPGEDKTISLEGPAKVAQIGMSLTAHIRRSDKELTTPTDYKDYKEVLCQAQWDVTTRKQVLFLKERYIQLTPPRFFNALRRGQKVALKEAGTTYEITVVHTGKASHKVTDVSQDGVMLEDVAGETEIIIPITSIKAILRPKLVR